MKGNIPLVITISRQLGSGGAYIGQKLAKKLGINYLDREILAEAARRLSVPEENLASLDEKLPPLWQSFLQFGALAPDVYHPPVIMEPALNDLFAVESRIIEHMARERPAVIIGRCGFHILRQHAGCVKIFLHADSDFRNRRIQELYNVTEKSAWKMILESDRTRAAYINTYTGKQWTDATLYDLSIDTARIGVDESAELVLNYLEFIPGG